MSGMLTHYDQDDFLAPKSKISKEKTRKAEKRRELCVQIQQFLSSTNLFIKKVNYNRVPSSFFSLYGNFRSTTLQP